jgi:hypothetical protein
MHQQIKQLRWNKQIHRKAQNTKTDFRNNIISFSSFLPSVHSFFSFLKFFQSGSARDQTQAPEHGKQAIYH